MTAYEVYKMYLALNLHFKGGSYDYFRYNGNVKSATPSNFDKRRDKRIFLKISRMRDPQHYLIGNFIFGENTGWSGSFTEDCKILYEKYLENGTYLFKQDLNKLNHDFNTNFTVDDKNAIPYILVLLKNGEISLHTCCVLDILLNCYNKWKNKEQFMIFENVAKKIHLSAPFFNIDKAKYKALLLTHFNV